MIAQLICLVLVAVGLLLIVSSIRPIYRISKLEKLSGWLILTFLLVFFVFGYGFFFFDLFVSETVDSTRQVISMIMFGGSVFVALVSKLSFQTILKANTFAENQSHYALHDNLTGLANRKYLFDTLELKISEQTSFVLLFIDLNNFKHINDGLGHQFGDKFLKVVSNRLATSLLDMSKIYRIGGDEFALVIEESETLGVSRVIDKMHRSIEDPVMVDNYPMKISISVGATRYPLDGNDVETLFKQADLAMYESKHKQNYLEYYRSEMGEASYERLNLLIQLSEAIRNSEFEVYYQPIVDATSGIIVSYEALIRWPQHDGKFIPPDKFIPLAEKSALICSITKRVIEQVSKDILTFRQRGFDGSVHINLSAKDLLSSDLLLQLDHLIEEGSLKFGDVSFEITESAMNEDLDKTKHVMTAMNRRGFTFSIDDFGTGFSSLVLLRELPIEQIKIDKSFILGYHDDETNRSIINSILNLAQDINCSVVAEGVETIEIRQKLQDLGCCYLQGYLFSKPQPLSNIDLTVKQYKKPLH
ncbi:putative bifunctional diguanylate cyclase/phosphodiesterase [Vibrio sp. WJH972]